MKKINEHILRITGLANMPQGLEIGKRYILEVEGDIYDIAERNNQDETFNITYKAKQTGNTKVLDNGKMIIKAEKKETRSQKLHGAIWYHWNFDLTNYNFEEIYDGIMQDLIFNLPAIIEYLKKKEGTYLNKIYNL